MFLAYKTTCRVWVEDESEVKKLFIHYFLFKVSLVILAFELGLHKFQTLVLGGKKDNR